MINDETIKTIIDYYGIETQSIVCMEECAELIQAISKLLRGGTSTNNLQEEIADVIICVVTLKEMYGIEDGDIQRIIDEKLERTLRRIEDAK